MHVSPSSPIPVSPERSASVILGRQGYLSVVLRLVGMELYKLRRRAMSKVLGIIAVALAVLPFALVAFGTFATANAPAGSFSPPCQSSAPNGQAQQGTPSNCPTPSAAQVAQERQAILEGASIPLRLPEALNVAVEYGLIVGVILLVILVGSIAGGEYSAGTIRLLFIRGPTRTQFLIAKLGTSFIVIVIGMLAMIVPGILVGQLLNPVSGIAQTGAFWSGVWLGHALLYVFIAMLNWFMFAVIAIFFATLGRSTAAGVVAGIGWLFAEPILGSVLTLLGDVSRGAAGAVLKAIPNYFISTSFSALLNDQRQYLSVSATSTPAVSVPHAIIVLLVYFAFFIGLTWWINKRRDVTN